MQQLISNKLAIVIPAYKGAFFQETLDSIAKQTNKSFIVYIGDDASPEDLHSVAEKYNDKIEIKYKRFENNIGQFNLVAHWNRCIELVQDEEWIWLFSDDDIMQEDCVEGFYEGLEQESSFDLFHYNVSIIDEKNQLIIDKKRQKKDFPPVLHARNFALLSMRYKINCFVVEFIFRKKTWIENGKFECFDLAWGSDIATWIKLSFSKGIRTLKKGRILWRASSQNISPNQSIAIQKRKHYATINFIAWMTFFFQDDTKFKWINYLRFLHQISESIGILSYKEILDSFVFYKEKTGQLYYSVFLKNSFPILYCLIKLKKKTH